MSRDLGTDPDELVAQRGQGPALHPLRQYRLLLMAEAVEKVWTIYICATNVPVSRAWCNSNSMKYGTMNHCFNDFALRDFFNSLG